MRLNSKVVSISDGTSPAGQVLAIRMAADGAYVILNTPFPNPDQADVNLHHVSCAISLYRLPT